MDKKRLKDFEKYENKQQKPLQRKLHSDKEINIELRNNYEELQNLEKKYNYNLELIAMLSVVKLSLNDLYGKEIDDLFYKVLDKVEIVIRNKRTDKLLNDYGYFDVNPGYLAAYTDCDPKNIFTPNICWEKDYIFIGDSTIFGKFNNIDIMENLIHELRHALSAQTNTNKYLNDKLFYKRCGLREYFFRSDTDVIEKGTIMDEVFNAYFTDVLLNNILNYKYNKIDNCLLYVIINRLECSPKYYYEGRGYSFEKEICKPLFYNREIVEAANKAALNGKFEDLYILFRDYYGYTDELDYISNDLSIKNEEEEKRFDETLNKFKIKTLNIAERRI